jgi:hypothetical protein
MFWKCVLRGNQVKSIFPKFEWFLIGMIQILSPRVMLLLSIVSFKQS